MSVFRLTVPARINILGNPSDGNEGDFATLTAAVEVRAGVLARRAPAGHYQFDWLAAEDGPVQNSVTLSQLLDAPAVPDQFYLQAAALKQLHQHSAEWREKVVAHGFQLSFWTEVPRQSGLGGSSLLVMLTLAALRLLYQLSPRQHHDYLLAELTQRTEEIGMGIACGYADRYAPLLGGLAYLDYRGKLVHEPLGEEPLVTYERLDHYVDGVPLVVCTSGIQHDSGDVHGRMRPKYLAEHAAWDAAGGQPPSMVRFMQAAWETAWRGKYALLAHDWPAFGALMNRNHEIVDEMMNYCGFVDGAGWANNHLIQSALGLGALGAKLTGAGGGGSVFALVPPAEQPAFLAGWRAAAAAAGLTEAQFYTPQLAQHGLIIEQVG